MATPLNLLMARLTANRSEMDTLVAALLPACARVADLAGEVLAHPLSTTEARSYAQESGLRARVVRRALRSL